jgi:hypothetical protein
MPQNCETSAGIEIKDIPIEQLGLDHHTRPTKSVVQYFTHSSSRYEATRRLIVRPCARGGYEVVVGRHLLATARVLGVKTLRCVIRHDLSDADAVALSAAHSPL